MNTNWISTIEALAVVALVTIFTEHCRSCFLAAKKNYQIRSAIWERFYRQQS